MKTVQYKKCNLKKTRMKENEYAISQSKCNISRNSLSLIFICMNDKKQAANQGSIHNTVQKKKTRMKVNYMQCEKVEQTYTQRRIFSFYMHEWTRNCKIQFI